LNDQQPDWISSLPEIPRAAPFDLTFQHQKMLDVA
jgi:hypothetical protein